MWFFFIQFFFIQIFTEQSIGSNLFYNYFKIFDFNLPFSSFWCGLLVIFNEINNKKFTAVYKNALATTNTWSSIRIDTCIMRMTDSPHNMTNRWWTPYIRVHTNTIKGGYEWNMTSLIGMNGKRMEVSTVCFNVYILFLDEK